jgi:hypothetical protein
MKNLIACVFVTALLASCSQSTSPTPSIATAEQAFTGGQPAIDGAINAESTETGAISRNDFSHWLGIETAEANVGCGSFASQDSCSASGVKSATYYGCESWGGGTILGSVTLTYSDTTCLLEVLGATLTRKALLTRESLPAGTMYTDSSNTAKTYVGGSAGGGTVISYVTTASYNLNINGVRKTLNDTSGNTIYDLVAQTSGPISVTGSLLGARVADSGSLVVYHNTAEYTATFSPSLLTYSDSTCCHPVSGTMSIAYAGSITGTATVIFNPACGLETFSMNGITDTVQLAGCE